MCASPRSPSTTRRPLARSSPSTAWTSPWGTALTAGKVAEVTGAYVNDAPGEQRYLQSTGFVLAPDSKVITAVYSSGAIGRLVPDDVAGLVRYLRDHG